MFGNMNGFNGLMSGEKMMKNMFRKVDSLRWDMMTGNIGVETPDGIASIEINKDDPSSSSISVNPMDGMAMALPAFAMSTPPDQINIGDMVITGGNGGIRGWVIEKKANGTFRVMSSAGMTSSWNPPKIKMLGFDSGVLIVKSMINIAGKDGTNQMGSMIQQMMLFGMIDGEGDLEEMMPMMLMFGGGMMGGATADNAQGGIMGGMGAGGMGGMMQMMMMSKLMKGMKSKK